MNVETAKMKIINHNNKKKKEKIEKEIENKKQSKYYKEQIRALEPRISKIIEIGNLCLENNIKIWNDVCEHKRYDENIFETDGINHQLGFFLNHYKAYPIYRCSKYDYIGFYNGGICGDWDFVTNGKDIFEVHEQKDSLTRIDNNATFREPTIYQMSKFLEQFNEFEEKFFNFINNL